MNHSTVKNLRKSAALIFGATFSFFAASAAFAQTAATTEPTDEPITLEKFTVTGSFIQQPKAAPMAPVAVFSEADLRRSGAMTPTQALRNLPSFVGNPGANENDSNGGDGSTHVSLRGMGQDYTLTLLDGRPAGKQSNLQMIPIEAIERIEVLRDGAGIIYGSSAIGGAVNIILKKNYSGFEVDLTGGGATRTPGGRDTFQASFVGGASNDKTSIVISGSYAKNRTLYARDRPNSASPDNRYFGGTNTGSPTFAGNVTSAALGTVVLKPGFSSSATPTSASDYVTMDQNGYSSTQLFNFRKYSPSAPGQKRNSLYFNIDHKIFDTSLEFFGTFFYSKLATLNGLAPAPFALYAFVDGPAIGDITQWGPYNELLGASKLLADDTDLVRYRSVELGNRSQEQVYNDFKVVFGLRGQIGKSTWRWEAAYTIDNEQYRQLDGGVPSLPKLDAEIAAGRFNPFALASSKGTATVAGVVYNWDNAKALKASEVTARQLYDDTGKAFNARVTGSLFELPAGDFAIAAGYDYDSNSSSFDADDLYASGSVLGLNSFVDDYTQNGSQSLFTEIKAPLISEKNNVPFVHDLSIGAIARNERQLIKGTNAVSGHFDSVSFAKTNPSINLQYSPTDNYKFRATWSKGFLVPASSKVFGAVSTDNQTLTDPLGFPTLAQTTVVIRGNPNLKPSVSKAWSVGMVAQPKNLVKNLSLTVDFYNISVDGIVANNAIAILAANAAGQGPGFVPGNAATINPNAPYAAQIRRSANGRLNNSGSFAAAYGVSSRGAVISDYMNVAKRDVSGLEYTVTYVVPTTDFGRFTFDGALNQFIKYQQVNAPGAPAINYLGRFVSDAGDKIAPGSIPKLKGNLGLKWSRKAINASVTFNYVDSYQDDPLFVMSPKMKAYYEAGTPKSDPAFAAYLADSTQLKVGGYRRVSAFETFDVQTGYSFSKGNYYLAGLSISVGVTNVFDKLAPLAAGAFNDSYDTRTANNIGRFCYMEIRKVF